MSIDTKYAVKDVFEGAAYEFRVSAVNLSGAGDPSIPCETVIARDPMSKLITQTYVLLYLGGFFSHESHSLK